MMKAEAQRPFGHNLRVWQGWAEEDGFLKWRIQPFSNPYNISCGSSLLQAPS